MLFPTLCSTHGSIQGAHLCQSPFPWERVLRHVAAVFRNNPEQILIRSFSEFVGHPYLLLAATFTDGCNGMPINIIELSDILNKKTGLTQSTDGVKLTARNLPIECLVVALQHVMNIINRCPFIQMRWIHTEPVITLMTDKLIWH